MAADKPVVQFSISSMRKEVQYAEPFRVALSGSKIITFPDVFAMESVEAEELFARLNRNQTNWVALKEWLGEKDAAALKAEKLTIIELGKVTRAAMNYYEEFYGESGEDAASASF